MKILYHRIQLEEGEEGYDPSIVDGKDLRNRIEDPVAGTGTPADPTFDWDMDLTNGDYDPEQDEFTLYTTSGWYIVLSRREMEDLPGLVS
jgi:hypothetical protein